MMLALSRHHHHNKGNSLSYLTHYIKQHYYYYFSSNSNSSKSRIDEPVFKRPLRGDNSHPAFNNPKKDDSRYHKQPMVRTPLKDWTHHISKAPVKPLRNKKYDDGVDDGVVKMTRPQTMGPVGGDRRNARREERVGVALDRGKRVIRGESRKGLLEVEEDNDDNDVSYIESRRGRKEGQVGYESQKMSGRRGEGRVGDGGREERGESRSGKMSRKRLLEAEENNDDNDSYIESRHGRREGEVGYERSEGRGEDRVGDGSGNGRREERGESRSRKVSRTGLLDDLGEDGKRRKEVKPFTIPDKTLKEEKRNDPSVNSFLDKFKLGFEKKEAGKESLPKEHVEKVSREAAPEDSEEIFRKMKENGLIPNAVAMLDGLCKDGLVQDAMRLFAVMREKGTIPEVVIYTAVVEGFCKAHKFDDAVKIFKKMKNNGIVPNAFSYTVLVQGLCKGKKLVDAFQLSVEMLEAGHSPNVVTFITLVVEFCKEKGVDEAENIIKRLREKDYFLNVKAVKEYLDKKGPFSNSVYEAIFGKKISPGSF